MSGFMIGGWRFPFTIEQIREKTGADTLGYISVEGLVSACPDCALDFCTGCFTGDYGK